MTLPVQPVRLKSNKETIRPIRASASAARNMFVQYAIFNSIPPSSSSSSDDVHLAVGELTWRYRVFSASNKRESAAATRAALSYGSAGNGNSAFGSHRTHEFSHQTGEHGNTVGAGKAGGVAGIVRNRGGGGGWSLRLHKA